MCGVLIKGDVPISMVSLFQRGSTVCTYISAWHYRFTSAAFSLPVSSTDRMIDADPIMLDKKKPSDDRYYSIVFWNESKNTSDFFFSHAHNVFITQGHCKYTSFRESTDLMTHVIVFPQMHLGGRTIHSQKISNLQDVLLPNATFSIILIHVPA